MPFNSTMSSTVSQKDAAVSRETEKGLNNKTMTQIYKPGSDVPITIRNWDGDNTPTALLSNAPYLIHGSVPLFAEGHTRDREFTSSQACREDRMKHARPTLGPQDKYVQPATAGQEIGWFAHTGISTESVLGGTVKLGQRGVSYHGLKKSDVTKHSESMIAGPRHC
eukprot:NODE_6847_length_813_cov_46.956522_g6611_i0.p1 GENE.NODE_6847_length_813_cov_46.956522_g6611_i0~~NODE_6847_length_813_cov_46.956522_g6611_i0.p1  ORF type:complete len:166 (+),score=18.37 NODE_6847_length_813_cov_46.956522_g6611_i0:73-570(+)